VDAERELRAALAQEPSMRPAWLVLARVLERQGRDADARAARDAEAHEARRAPRGYPYGVGTGEVLEWGVARRPLLLWDGEGLRVAPPRAFARGCA
jgi:hypothetical protein